MDELTCPCCATEEHLSGQRAGDVIHITCTRCGLTWDRDTSPRCASCGDTDVRTITEPASSRRPVAPQLSIVGVTTRYLCSTCYKRDYVNRDYRHISQGQNPAR